MRSINKVILIGNLTRDPEMKKTAGGQTVTIFGIATNREWMTKDGRKEKDVEFHEIVCFAKLGEIAGQFLKKGKLVYIEGHIKTRSWDDATGLKRFRTEIVAEDMTMLDRRPKDLDVPTKGSLTADSEPAESMQPSVSMEDPLTI